MRRGNDAGSGWVTFAGVMVTLAGILSMFGGIAAISTSRFSASSAGYSVSDLRTWGWIGLFVGIVELAAAYLIFQGGEFGRWFGILASGRNAISALMAIRVYPFWGICLFAIDVLIIYALAANGGRAATI